MTRQLPDLITMNLNDLHEWDGNARQGDVDVIKESMRTNGVFQPIVVQASTGKIIAGNHRYKALVQLQKEYPDSWPEDVSVLPLNVSDEEAARIHVADNRTSDMAEWDRSALLDQLEELDVTDLGLAGTGFDSDEVEELRKALADASDDDWGDALDAVSDSDPTVATRSFSFPASMATVVDDAIDKAKNYTVGDGNANGEALVHLCQEFLDDRS